MVNHTRLNALDVIRLLGDVESSTVTSILGTGGTGADLEIAYFCLMGDNDRQEGQLGPLAGNAARIFEILRNDPLLAPLERS